MALAVVPPNPTLNLERQNPTEPTPKPDSPTVRPGTDRVVARILVATDFSADGSHAIEHAASLTEQHRVALTILHVIDVTRQNAVGTAQEFGARLWDEARTHMRGMADLAAKKVDVRTLLVEGLPWEVIAEASKDFDLVVLGSNRRPRRKGWFSQHTLQRVTSRSHCSVVVVPLPG